jgi:hypothetical protein
MSALLAALIILVPAPPANDEPFRGLAPTLQFVRWNNGTLEQTVTVWEQEPKEVTETVNTNGRTETRKTIILTSVYKRERRAINAKDTEVYDLDGKKVEDAAWQKALANGAIVLLAVDGVLPHATFRSAIKDGTLIVVLKPQSKPSDAPPK